MKNTETSNIITRRDIVINQIVKGFKKYLTDNAPDLELAHYYDAYAGCRDCPVFTEDCFCGDCATMTFNYLNEERRKNK